MTTNNLTKIRTFKQLVAMKGENAKLDCPLCYERHSEIKDQKIPITFLSCCQEFMHSKCLEEHLTMAKEDWCPRCETKFPTEFIKLVKVRVAK